MYKIKARPSLALATRYLLLTLLLTLSSRVKNAEGQNLQPGSPCYEQDEDGKPITSKPVVRQKY